jgi:hypothetical protein
LLVNKTKKNDGRQKTRFDEQGDCRQERKHGPGISGGGQGSSKGTLEAPFRPLKLFLCLLFIMPVLAPSSLPSNQFPYHQPSVLLPLHRFPYSSSACGFSTSNEIPFHLGLVEKKNPSSVRLFVAPASH